MAPDNCIDCALSNIDAVFCQDLCQSLASSDAPFVLLDSLHFLRWQVRPIMAEAQVEEDLPAGCMLYQKDECWALKTFRALVDRPDECRGVNIENSTATCSFNLCEHKNSTSNRISVRQKLTYR